MNAASRFRLLASVLFSRTPASPLEPVAPGCTATNL